jgi:hypothetical protein
LSGLRLRPARFCAPAMTRAKPFARDLSAKQFRTSKRDFARRCVCIYIVVVCSRCRFEYESARSVICCLKIENAVISVTDRFCGKKSASPQLSHILWCKVRHRHIEHGTCYRHDSSRHRSKLSLDLHRLDPKNYKTQHNALQPHGVSRTTNKTPWENHCQLLAY